MNQIMNWKPINVSPFMAFVFIFLLQASSNVVKNDPIAITQSPCYVYLGTPQKEQMQTLGNEMDKYRFKRSIEDVPSIDTASSMNPKSVYKLNVTLSLDTNDMTRISALEKSIDNFQISLGTRIEQLQQEVMNNVSEKMQNHIQEVNILQKKIEQQEKDEARRRLEQVQQEVMNNVSEKMQNLIQEVNILQKKIEQQEKDEARRRLPEEIISDIQSEQFSKAAEKLKRTDDGICKLVLRKIYNGQAEADSFNLLLGFGHAVEGYECKFKIYDGVFHKMKDTGHLTLRDQFRISNYIKNEIIDKAPGAIAAISFYENVKNEIKQNVVDSIMKNGAVIDISSEECFQCTVEVCEQIIKELWGKLTMVDILGRGKDKLKNVDVQVAYQIAAFNRLEYFNEVDLTYNAEPLAQSMKSSMNDNNYHLVNSDARSRFEEIKTKLPKSVKDSVFI